MVEAAARHDRVVQIGFQRRQSKAFRRSQEAHRLRRGGQDRAGRCPDPLHRRAERSQAARARRWTGTSGAGRDRRSPIVPRSDHGAWRLEQTYGNGHLVAIWGIHWIDASRKILDLAMPRSITAGGGIYQLQDKITTPDTLTVHFEFDRVPIVWRHRIWGAGRIRPKPTTASSSTATRRRSSPPTRVGRLYRRTAARPLSTSSWKATCRSITWPISSTAVRTRKQPTCRIADAYKFTATVQLAMIAYETGTSVTWDAARKAIAGNTAASALLEVRVPHTVFTPLRA